MKVTSTQFQQNVGFYLNEAANGKIINIQKLKPQRQNFKLIAENEIKKENEKDIRNKKILNLIKKFSASDKETGLEFQRRVRD